MAADAAHAYLRNQVALRRFGDVWVRWAARGRAAG